MKSSESISALATAMSKFTGEIEDAKKTSKAHQYMYADLPTLLQLARPVLTKHGLSVSQFPMNDGDKIGVCTRLMHESGEWLESSFSMTVQSVRQMSDAQAVGSTLTYFRRYALAACLGISQEDDDGKSALPKPSAPKSPLATKEQKAAIVEHKEAGTLPKRWESWCGVKEQWARMTESQADSILLDCRRVEVQAG